MLGIEDARANGLVLAPVVASDVSRSSRQQEPLAGGKRFWSRVALLAGAGLALRLFLVATVPTQPVSDYFEYLQRAGNIVRLGVYDAVPGHPDANHPPAYPLLLAAAISLTHAHLLAAKLANCTLALLTILAGAGLARDLWGDRAGLWTAGVFAFYPRQLLMPLVLASENLFCPLLLLFVWVAAKRWRGDARPARLAAAAGLLVGLLALTRTVAYVLWVVWLLGAVLAKVRWREIAAELALLLLVEHLVMLPWAVRNQRAVGRFTFLTTVGGIGLYIGNNPRADGDWHPWQKGLERLRPGIFARGDLAVDRAAREEAIRWIRGQPSGAARLYVKKLWIILVQDRTVGWWAIYGSRIGPPNPGKDVIPGPHLLKEHRAAVFATLRVSAALLVVLAVGGAIVLLARARRERTPFARALAVGYLAAVFYVPLLSAPIAVNGRYRWPSEDLSVPLAAMFVASWRGRSRGDRGESVGREA